MIKIFVSYVIAIISHRVSVILSISIYAGLLVFSVHQSWQQPAANWDALPYTALALRWDGHSENELRTAALAEVRTAFPGHYDNFVSGGPADAYKQAVSTDDSSFFAQLPFYAIKPLYVAGVFLLGKLEGNFGIATAHLSALAFVFISFFAAMACPRGVPIVIWLTGLITVTSYIGPFPLTLLAAASTPDALSGALFLGAILLARKEKLGVATLLLLLSQLARPDAIVPIMTFLLALAVINPQRRLMLLTTAGMAIGVRQLVSMLVPNYPLEVLLSTLISRQPHPGTMFLALGSPEYFHVLTIFLEKIAANHRFLLFNLVGIFSLLVSIRRRAAWPVLFLLTALSNILAHILLFPEAPYHERFYFTSYLLVLMASGYLVANKGQNDY